MREVRSLEATGALALLVFCLVGLAGCGTPTPAAPVPPVATTVITPAAADAAPQLTRQALRFADVTRAAGINWTYRNGAAGQHLFVETTGGGVAFIDYNRDGYPDLFAAQGGSLPSASSGVDAQLPGNAFYRNNGDGSFTDVTKECGLDVPTGYGQGVAAADYDNDGWPDLYITSYGGSHLFRNTGRGAFIDVTEAAGVADRGDPSPWPLSAAWGDYNRDGRLDLFVCHYVSWSPKTNQPCRGPDQQLSYCRPQVYEGTASRLYRGNRDGTFTDVSKKAGVADLIGKSMGATWVDYDADDWPDLFVTNDTTQNFLLRNNRNGTFTDRAILAGVAVGALGQPMSGMGIGVGDYDNDGLVDLFDVNFAAEPKGVWRNTGQGLFENRSYASNLASTNLQFLGFGLELCDYDLDGRQDLVVGNGHVLDDPSSLGQGATYAQSQQLLRNAGSGLFQEDLRSLGDLALPRVTRGLAVGDYDLDGDLDVAMVAQNGPLQLFRNEGGETSHWIQFRCEAVKGVRNAIGARISGLSGKLRVTGWVSGGGSYCSSSDRTVVLGLGTETELRDTVVRWPSGKVQPLGDLASNRRYLLREGSAPVPEEAFRKVSD